MPVNELCRERILSDNYPEIIRDYAITNDMIPEDIDACVQQVNSRMSIVYVNRDQYTNPSYIYNRIPKLYTLIQEQQDVQQSGVPFDSQPLESSGILSVQRPPLELTGTGVVIGFIDTGIDYRNPAFRYRDGSTRILGIWDQTIQEGEPPDGFDYGTQYTSEMINEALTSDNPLSIVPSIDENGHGTAMAGLAAGSSNSAAPNASIVMVKLKGAKPYLRKYYSVLDDAIAYAETDIILAVKYLTSFLKEYERPVVICIGLGTNMTDHAGKGMLSQYLIGLTGRPNLTTVVAGGNEGNARHHYFGTVASGLDSNMGIIPTSNTDGSDLVEIHVGENENGFLMELWAQSPDVYTISIRSPGGELIPRISLKNQQRREYNFIYEKTRVTVSYDFVEWETGDLLILIKMIDPTPGIWTLTVYGCEESNRNCPASLLYGTFHIWLPITGFIQPDTYFIRPNPEVTLTSPSNTAFIMTTSTYDSANNSFYLNSGRGFTRTGRIKPDLGAPGVNITVVKNDSISTEMRAVRYERRSGSCYGAAIAAGASALFLEWAVIQKNNIEITAQTLRNFFIRGAIRDGNAAYPNQEFGFGRLNLKGAFDSMTIY